MATYTDNYNLVKPTMAETADIRTINGNMDSVDNIMHATQVSMAPAYDSSETYNNGDIVMYEFLMYECLDDNVTGTWDATKWQRTTAGEHGGGSDVEITPTLQSGTKIADFEIDGVSGALYAPSGGGGGGGGSSQTIADVLWSGSATPSTAGTDITLNHAISDYDFIVFIIEQGAGYSSVVTVPTSELTVGEAYINTGYSGSQMDVFFTYVTDTSINVKSSASAQPTTYTKIVGLKICGTLAPMIYSTEEREVGVWVDDKPLYQKSYLLSTPIEISSSGVDVSSYIDNYQDIECFVRGQASYTDTAYPKQGADIWIGYDSSTLKVYCSEGCWANVITLLYTKTADVAGSGSYGSLGVPMEHYDNTEKVVGTYFGETLYQKTIPNISITGTTNTISTGANIGTLVAVEATGYKIDGGGNIIRFKESYNDGGDTFDVEGINNDIRAICSSWFIGSTIDITIKYTKSTT